MKKKSSASQKKSSANFSLLKINPKSQILLIVCLFLLAGFFAGYTLNNSDSKSDSNSSAIPQIQTRVFEGQSFTVSYPGNLNYQSEDGSNAPVALLKDVPTVIFSDASQKSVIMIREFESAKVSFETASKSYFNMVTQNWSDIRIGEYNGQLSPASSTSADRMLGLVAILEHKDRLYYFHYAYSQDSSDAQMLNNFYQILGSFQIKNL